MNYLVVLALTGILQVCFAPPVSNPKKEEEDDSNHYNNYIEYNRYLREVVNALHSDPEFLKKLENANETLIKSGKIADELEFVSHSVRTKLDEVKRIELQRLKELVEKKRKLENQIDDVDDPVHHHLDQTNPHTFEIEDLKKLIAKSMHDMAAMDKERREKFKEYEMEKEYQKIDKLNHTKGEAERAALEKQFKEQEEKHKKHEKLHEPGHEAQLKEVWEEQDQMQQDFDPKTFFMLHDLDGNGLLDQDEVKALFYRELDKVYQAGIPEDDLREKVEEMERMRESTFNEMDFNKDGFIDFEEFIKETKTDDFKQDDGWKTLDELPKPYNPEDLEEYIRRAHGENEIPQEGAPHSNQTNNDHQQQQVQPGQVPHNQQIPPQNQQIPYNNQHYQQVPYQNQQVPPQNQQVPPQNQQVPYQNQQVPLQNQNQQVPYNQQVAPQNQQQAPYQNQQLPYQNQEVPYQNQQVPPQNQQVPSHNQQVPPQNQQIPYNNQHYQQVPYQNQQVPPQNQQVPPQNQQVPYQNQQVPYQNQQVPPQNQQVPYQNQQVPYQNQQVPPQNQQVPYQNQQVPYQNQQVPPQNQQVLPQNQQVPDNHQVPPQNPQIPPQNQQIPPQNPQIPPQNQQVPNH